MLLQDILVKLGWELMMVIPVNDGTIRLINKIAEVHSVVS